jgi:gliding motility-associated-like protein
VRVAGLFWIAILMCLSVSAKHIAGGEISYIYLGPGATANTIKYRVLLRLYRECDAPQDAAQLDPNATFGIFATGSSASFLTRTVPLEKKETVLLTTPDPCIGNPPRICYEIGFYSFEVDLPITSTGYTISYQRCCRIDGIFNLINSQFAGATYSAFIPGNTTLVPNAVENSSPVFRASDTVIICANSFFKYDFGATDVDKDALEYRFEEAYIGGSTNQPAPPVPTAPPYAGVNYNFGFSSISPLGPDVIINAQTGMISGTAPNAGIYVVTVAVVEKRSGQIINIHRKDLHLKVADCTVAAAELDPSYITCDGLTLRFFNKSTSPLIKTYDWDFGISNNSSDESTESSPAFTYPQPGEYVVRLITNRNDKCSDTATTIAKVYPGFTTDFTIQQTCRGIPYSFIDNSQTVYGTVNKWKWDFGNTSATNDTAITKNASYTYTQSGIYNVSLIVFNSLGCVDTVFKQLDVGDKPALFLSGDTVICNIDTLQLNAVGTGTFSWSPNYMINDNQINNPLVSPDVPTRYTVTLTQAPGCENTKSIFVDVKTFVSLNVGADTTICLGDSILLQPITDGVNFRWSPASTVSTPDKKFTWVKPTETTRYSLFSTIGKCQANDGLVIATVPYPLAFAGRDTAVCYGDQVQLFASGGSQYLWQPGNTLNDQTLQNPIAQPWQTTDYIVGVYDNQGCPKPVYDTIQVRVVPPVPAFAGNDTVVVIGEPLQLQASGGAVYRWTPGSFLNNPNIPNPIARLNDDISYVVRVATPEGCFATDTMQVKVYKTPPEIFVPTVFTPNDDGLNDKLTPIPVGIRQMLYFKVYNRYGELVFSTDIIGKGWNGIFRGKDQGNESFVWHALGIDYLGNEVFRKGQFTLIR